MNILALDLGTHMGFCHGDTGGELIIGTKHLATAAEVKKWRGMNLTRTGDPRVDRLFKWVKAECLAMMPDVLIWEDVEFATYAYQTQLWASFRTAVQMAGTVCGIKRLDCVPVTTLKKFATKYGGAKKEHMAAALYRENPEWAKRGFDDNAIDAVWLWKWAKHNLIRISEVPMSAEA